MPALERNLMLAILIVSLFIISPTIFRQRYRNRQPLINATAIALNHSADFINLTGFPYEFLQRRYLNIVTPYLNYTRESLRQWIVTQDRSLLRLSVGGRPNKQSPTERALMAIFCIRDYNQKLMELMFGMAKSGIYVDTWLIFNVFLTLVGEQELTPPLINTVRYWNLVGAGVFRGIFPEAVYIMDCHLVDVVQPAEQQSNYYNGRTKTHCVNFLTVHTGLNGKAVFVHGGEAGIVNDIVALHRSEFGQNVGLYVDLANEHWVASDGIWRHEGEPFVCKFCERSEVQLTVENRIFNYAHARTRVLCENWYCRLHKLFPILNKWSWRLDKLDVVFRVCAILTNAHIDLKPLR